MKYRAALFICMILSAFTAAHAAEPQAEPTNLNRPSGAVVRQKLQYMGYCQNDGRPAKLVVDVRGLKAEGEMTAYGIDGKPYPKTVITFHGNLSDNWRNATVRLQGRWKGEDLDHRTGERIKGFKTKGDINLWWEGGRILLVRDKHGTPFVFDPSTEINLATEREDDGKEDREKAKRIRKENAR